MRVRSIKWKELRRSAVADRPVWYLAANCSKVKEGLPARRLNPDFAHGEAPMRDNYTTQEHAPGLNSRAMIHLAVLRIRILPRQADAVMSPMR